MKKYNIIYADPPWKYNDKSLNRGGAERYYKTMNIEDIKKLPIKDIANKDCVLFLWATFPKIREALDLIEAWGFEYKTNAFTWVKRNPKSDGWFWGMGRWTRSNAEVCLFATKGKPKRISASVHSVIDNHIEQHSKKPDEIRERIIQLMGDLPRVELFARQQSDGWDIWGNELENDIELGGCDMK